MSHDYEVGYARPPKHTRFKKGRSGNPKGRPKGSRNLKTDLQEELQETVIVREGETRKTLSKQRAMLKTVTAKAMQGDPRATAIVVDLALRLLGQEETGAPGRHLDEVDQAILEAYEERILQRQAPRGSPAGAAQGTPRGRRRKAGADR